jgi:hypothetical protein
MKQFDLLTWSYTTNTVTVDVDQKGNKMSAESWGFNFALLYATIGRMWRLTHQSCWLFGACRVQQNVMGKIIVTWRSRIHNANMFSDI